MKGNYKHGMRHSRLYNIWRSMRQRCQNKSCINYHRYGARGISVCDEWEDFNTFLMWAGDNGYADDLSIDRIDVNGNYEPSNCRWATAKEQSNNRRNNVLVEIAGCKYTLSELSEMIGIKHGTLWYRWKNGWSEDRLLISVKN